ncbi:hypothetical protein ACLUXW_07885 [Limosilactobacillus reuteri subsp. suis]|uniref:hypothetical protein n=1 Tax=Limosilactobacillus reuteri TaxID=1598 RepID=UPI003991C7A3
MKVVKTTSNSEVQPFNDWVNITLSDGRVLGDHISHLPIGDAQKEVMRQVESKDTRVSKYVLLHANDGKLPLKIRTVKALKGYSIDIINAVIYTPDGKIYDNYRTNNSGYISPRIGSIALHELVYFEYLYRVNKALYEKVKANRSDYEIHHIQGWKKRRQEGNGLFNLRLLPKNLHYQYKNAVNMLERAYSNGKWKPLVWWTSIPRSKPNKQLLK